jgi:hypothetical protein
MTFPHGFPPELAAEAFAPGNEAAWQPEFAIKAVGWLAAHDYAVIGTELWLLQGNAIQSLPIGRSGQREVNGNVVDREHDEDWSSFVARAAAKTREYLISFKVSDIVEHGQIYFNVTWVSENEFNESRHSAKK